MKIKLDESINQELLKEKYMLGYFRLSRIIFIILVALYFAANIMIFGTTNIITYIISHILHFILFIIPIYYLVRLVDNIVFKNLFDYWYNCEIEVFIRKISKMLKYYHTKSSKNYLELLLAQCYIKQTN